MAKQDTLPPRRSLGNQDAADEKRDEARETSSEDLPTLTSTEGDLEYVTGFKLTIVIAACTTAGFLMLLDTSIVATAIPRITSDFHSLPDIGWYGTAYQLANSAFQPLTGKIYNQFDSRYTFIFFLCVFELGSLLCGVAVSSTMLIIGRAVAGIGGSGLLNGGLTIIRACVPIEKSAMYLGILMGIVQLGILLGPLIGGALTQYATWRWCFYVNLPVGGIVVFVLFFIHIPDRRPKSEIKSGFRAILQSFDLPGFAIFASAAIMFLLAVEWGGTKYNWNSATVIGLFCGSAGTLALFILWEHRRGDTAMLPLSMLKQRIVWSSCLTYFFINANMLVTSFYMAIYFQAVCGVSPTLSGVYLLPSVLSQMFLAMCSGVQVGRFGYYLPWAIASGALASIGTGLLTTLMPDTSTVKWVFFQIIAGVGRGCGLQMPIVAVQNALKPELVSVGLAAVVFSQGFGPALFLSFAQTIFSNSLTDKLHDFAPEVDAQTVFNAGATGIRAVISVASLPGVIMAYNKAVNNVFYLITGAAIAAFVTCWGMGWKSVKKAKVASPEV